VEIAYVNIYVSELSKAVEFYRDTLGLELGFADADHGYASFQAGTITLGLAVAGEDHPELVGVHTGVGFNTPDLEADHRRLAALGVEFPMSPSRQPWGGFMALFSDPDGNAFYLDEIATAHS